MWKRGNFLHERTQSLWSTLCNRACARTAGWVRDSECLVSPCNLSVIFEDTNKKICQERKQYNTVSVYAPGKDHTTLGKVCTSPSQFKSTTLCPGQWHFCSEKLGFLPFSLQRPTLAWQPCTCLMVFTSDGTCQVFTSLTSLSRWQKKIKCDFQVACSPLIPLLRVS